MRGLRKYLRVMQSKTNNETDNSDSHSEQPKNLESLENDYFDGEENHIQKQGRASTRIKQLRPKFHVGNKSKIY